MFISFLKIMSPLIIEAARKLLEGLGSAPSLNQKSTVSDVEQLSNALRDLREYVMQKSKPTIDNANDSLAAYIEEQLFVLEDKTELLTKYEISSSSVKHKLEDINRRLNNFWNDALRLRISLDNQHCREILTMPSGERKTAEIARFTENVLAETLNQYAENVKAEFASLYVDLESEIARTVSRLEKTVDEYADIIQALNDKDDDKFERLIAQAQIQIACCDAMIQKVRD